MISPTLQYLIDLVQQIRPNSPRNVREAEDKFKRVLRQLETEPVSLSALQQALLSQLTNTEILQALIESGIISSRGFVQELGRKMKHKLLPGLLEEQDLLFVISRVFYRKTDYIWVSQVNQDLWKQFFKLVHLSINMKDSQLISQLHASLRILSFRLTTLGWENEIWKRLEKGKLTGSPFVEQNRLVMQYLEQPTGEALKRISLLYNIQEQLYHCRQNVLLMRDQRAFSGTSLSLTFLTTRILQMTNRMLLIADALDGDQHFNEDRFVDFFVTVVTNENKKNSIREFLSDNLGLLAYQITEHKGKKGEKYIATDGKAFGKLFYSALKGGAIVSFVAVIKNLIGKLILPPFWMGFAYSTNYAAGFIIMDQTHSTLATKQPAYTASTLANALDSKKQQEKPDLKNLAITVANTARSQIASFAGNLLVVFPLTYVVVWCLKSFFGYVIVDNAKALHLLEDQHPWHSPALLYACFTGVFLFLSGIISGYVDNHVVYGQMTERLKSHPVLTNRFSPKRLDRLAGFVNNYAGTFSGSLALGFFLGMSTIAGKIFGIPFDIRHITISAGNAAIGFFGSEEHLSLSYLLIVFLGVLGIGFLNFFVSFSLAFFVAVRSRGIRLRDYPELIGYILRYFRRFPADFIFPPLKTRLPEQI